MGTLCIKKGKDAEAGEVFLSLGEHRLQEVFSVSADLSEQELRGLGYVPLEELFPGQVIDGYAELGETLYATTWD
jgi:hypothetical protein